MATQGSPAKFSYCIAENEAASPWGPMATGDTVTVYGGEPPHNVNDHVSTTASGILNHLCDTAVSLGSNGWYFSQSQLLVVLDRSTRRRLPTTASRAPTCSASSTSTRVCRSTPEARRYVGCTTGRAG